MLALGSSQTAFFQSPFVTAQKGIHRLMHDIERVAVVSAHRSAYCRIASGRIESYVKLATHLVVTSEGPWRLPAPIPGDEKLRSFNAQIPFSYHPAGN